MVPVNVIANYYTDAGHGWIEVSKAVLARLGIADKITAYSYEKGGMAYLEEDCDASLLQKAVEATGAKLVTFDIYHGYNSQIRSYSRYQAGAV